jgi:hypothetical protein
MKTMMTVAALTATCLALPAVAATEADCVTMWNGVNKSNAAVLSDADAQRYTAAMRVRAYKLPEDGKVTRDVFIDACKADVYVQQKSESGAPLKGANSFTEGQAKDRALAHGFTGVGSLVKDGDGIWRGSAMWDGKATQVAVDFKGNVVPVTQ